MVAAVHYYATRDDQEHLLDYLGEPTRASLYPWPLMSGGQNSLSRDAALASPAVMVVRPDVGLPRGLNRKDLAKVSTTKRDVFHRMNWESLRPARSQRLVDSDSPVLHWNPAPSSSSGLELSAIGSQADSMRAVSLDYERWVNRVMSWVRRWGTKVWGLETTDVRPDLDIRLSIVSTVYALPHALAFLESGGRGSGL